MNRKPASSHCRATPPNPPFLTGRIGSRGFARVSCRRRGAFTVVVLVCLLISTMLLASLLKLALMHDGQSEHVLLRLQTAWLAESGLERAAERLAAGPAYNGETWTIKADRLGGLDAA